MGYFNSSNLGEITGVVTTVLEELENTGPVVLVNMLGGLMNALVFLELVLIFDWRVGLLAVAGTILYLLITSSMERKSAKIAPKRQASEARMVSAVLEQIQGMSVIKSFNLTGKGDKKVRDALEENRRYNFAMERLFTSYTMAQGSPPPCSKNVKQFFQGNVSKQSESLPSDVWVSPEYSVFPLSSPHIYP